MSVETWQLMVGVVSVQVGSGSLRCRRLEPGPEGEVRWLMVEGLDAAGLWVPLPT